VPVANRDSTILRAFLTTERRMAKDSLGRWCKSMPSEQKDA
jgi:hypothetical protein